MRRIVLIVSVLSLSAAGAPAALMPVGSGASNAMVVINFKDGAIYEFALAFDGSPTGIGLFDIIEDATTLTTVRQDFGWGVFIDGISYDGHSNMGFGGGEDWWHYWIKDSALDPWQAPMYGAADRAVTDGCSDGWVYGGASEPVPEPATMALLAAGAGAAMIHLRRKR